MKARRSSSCEPRLLSHASSIRINKSSPARSPRAGTHSVTGRRSLPCFTMTSSCLISGTGLSPETLAVTVIFAGTVDDFSCPRNGAAIVDTTIKARNDWSRKPRLSRIRTSRNRGRNCPAGNRKLRAALGSLSSTSRLVHAGTLSNSRNARPWLASGDGRPMSATPRRGPLPEL
jgi:hypothetical protein